MKKVIQKVKNIHYLLHFNPTSFTQQFFELAQFLYLSQLFNLAGTFSPNKELITLYSLIRGTFIFNLIQEKYFSFVQILMLLFNCILILSIFIALNFNISHKQKNWRAMMLFINLMMNVYPYLFYIPVIWLNINQCFTETIIYFIIALFNILSALILALITIFYSRGDILSLNENVTTTAILIRIILKFCEFLTIYFSFFSNTISDLLQMAILFFNIILNVFKITDQSQTKIQLNILFLLFNIVLHLDFRLMDYLLLSTLLLSLQIQLHEKSIQSILFKGETVASCQLAEKIYKRCMTDKQARIQLQIFKNKHNCTKCKAFYDIIECILKRKVVKLSEKLIYTNFICKKWPLRALVELLKEQKEDFYFRSAVITFQKLNEQTFDISNYIFTSYKSQIVCEGFIQKLLKLIESIIKFWNQILLNDMILSDYYKSVQKVGRDIKALGHEISKVYNLKQFRLNDCEISDIITLRLLQIYFCVAEVDLINAQKIEEKILELFRSDKYRQLNTIDNNQLATNRQLLLTTSLIYNSNKLIKPNYQQMSLFFEASVEEINFIRQTSEILPPFISGIHDSLIENFIQKGYSRLSQAGKATFYQDLKGYIIPCYIHMIPLQGQSDYFINAILTKDLNENEVVIFGMSGKIYGISQTFFQFTLNSIGYDNYSRRIQITDLIEKGSLIQYYVENIVDQVRQLKQAIEKHQNFTIAEVQSTWAYPENHVNCIFNTSHLLKQQFSSSYNQAQSFSNFMSQKTYLQTSKQSEKTVQVSELDESGSSNNKELILEGVEWSILNQNYHSSIKQMLDQFGETLKSNRIKSVMNYSLSFRKIEVGKKVLGYFVMEVKEFRQEVSQKTTSNYITVYQTRKSGSSKNEESMYTFPEEEIEQINSEKGFSENDLNHQIGQIKNHNHLSYLNKLENDKLAIYNNYISSMNVTKQKMQSYDFENSSRLLKIQTDRQPKKQLLTTRVEFQSMNHHNDDEEIMNGAEIDFQEIAVQKKIENPEDIDDEMLEFQQDRMFDRDYRKMKTKVVQEQASNKTNNKQTNSLRETFQYLQQISESSFTLASLKKFTYFSICVLILLIINISLESYNLQNQVQSNEDFISTQQDLLNLYSISSVKLITNLISSLINKELINMNALVAQLSEKQQNQIYQQNYYSKQYVLMNSYQSVNYSQQEYDEYQFNMMFQEFQDSMRQIANTSEYNNFSFSEENLYLLNYISDTLNQNLNNYEDKRSDFLSTIIFALCYFCLILYQIRFLFAKQKVILKLLKLTHQTNIQKIQNQIARLQTINETFDGTHVKNWKLTSYISIISEEMQNEKVLKKKQNHDLEGNIGQMYIYPNVIVIIFLITYVVVGQILKQTYYQEKFLTTEISFLQLNVKLDHSLLCGALIKALPLFQSTTLSLQKQIILNFSSSNENQINLSNDIIYNLEKILQQQDSSNLFNFYQKLVGNQCDYYYQEVQICASQDSIKYYPEIYSIIEKGILSIVNNLQKVINTEYLHELTEQRFESDKQDLQYFISSQSYIDTFLIFFCETINILNLQIQELQQILKVESDSYVEKMLMYEISVGMSIGVLYLIYGFLTQVYHKNDFKYIIYFLRTIPNEQLQQRNILHQIKSIVQEK